MGSALPTASVVPCAPGPEPCMVCSEPGGSRVPLAANSPVLPQRSVCTGPRVSLAQVRAWAGAIGVGGAQFPSPSARVSLWAEHPDAGEHPCIAQDWPGAQGKYLYPPKKAGGGGKNLLHVVAHDCCIQPCHCPPRAGIPISASCIHSTPEPVDFASWGPELLRLPTAGTQGSCVFPWTAAWGSTVTERSFLFLYTSFLFFLFGVSWGQAPACPAPSPQIAGREGAFLGPGHGAAQQEAMAAQEEQPQHRFGPANPTHPAPLCQVLLGAFIG